MQYSNVDAQERRRFALAELPFVAGSSAAHAGSLPTQALAIETGLSSLATADCANPKTWTTSPISGTPSAGTEKGRLGTTGVARTVIVGELGRFGTRCRHGYKISHLDMIPSSGSVMSVIHTSHLDAIHLAGPRARRADNEGVSGAIRFVNASGRSQLVIIVRRPNFVRVPGRRAICRASTHRPHHHGLCDRSFCSEN